jgi:hypothetical protein
MATITIPHDDLQSAFNTLDRLGIKAGQGASVELDATVHILDESIDRLVQTYRRQRQQPEPPPEAPGRCIRLDRCLPVPPWANHKLLGYQARFINLMQEAGDDRDRRRELIDELQSLRRSVRLRIIRATVQGDIIAHQTVVYGANVLQVPLEGALPLSEPTGEAMSVKRLIHLTHPTSPEDLYLREKNITCETIYRYRCPGLDDAEWNLQNEPRVLIDAIGYRELLEARWRREAI